jgi:glycosidase
MNYPFARSVVDWLRHHDGMSSSQLAERLAPALHAPPQFTLVQMNLVSSHDTQRLASAVANPTFPFDSGGNADDLAKGYDAGRPAPEVYDLAELAFAIQAICTGAPMVYGGEEWGMHGAKDPDCRKPIPWPDLPRPDNSDDSCQPAFRERVAAWLRLRSHEVWGPILRFGDAAYPKTGNERVFAVGRSLNGYRLILIANASATPFDARTILGESSPVWPPTAIPSLVPGRSGALFCVERAGASP